MAKNSKLPSELNENWGSNYMMDGFDFDMDYGAGVADPQGKELLPQPPQSGFAKLPDGVIAEEASDDFEVDSIMVEDGLDLAALGLTPEVELSGDDPSLEAIARQAAQTLVMENDREDPAIVDLTWLSEAYQDPDRLPDGRDMMVEELQQCWGDRTDGIYRIDLRDREELQYQDAQQGPEDDDTLNRDKLAKLVRSAMRKSAAGVSLPKILDGIRAQISSNDIATLKRSVQLIKNEHGLVGNVYVRASAYPGLHRGKWASQFRKASKKARYLIACPGEDCGACAAATGLKQVDSPSDIDWSWVYAKYAPELSKTGRLTKKASKRNIREVLRLAFLAKEVAPSDYVESHKPIEVQPADRVSSEQALQAWGDHKPTAQQRVSQEGKHKSAAMKRTQERILAWGKSGLLTRDEVKGLLSRKASSSDMIKEAARIVVNRKSTAEYEGQGEGLVKAASIAYGEAKKVLSVFSSTHKVEKVKSRKKSWDQYQRELLEAKKASDRGDTVDLLQIENVRREATDGEKFGLHNASLDTVNVSEESTPDNLDGVMFGGFEL